MKVGIVSDTHDRYQLIDHVIEIFKIHRVKVIFHAGDFTDISTIKKFKGLLLFGVLGNKDNKLKKLIKYFPQTGVEISTKILEKEIGGIKFVVYHGTKKKTLNNLIKSKKYDVVIYGHTHKLVKRLKENCIILNPGPVSGIWSRPSIMIFDTKNRQISIVYF